MTDSSDLLEGLDEDLERARVLQVPIDVDEPRDDVFNPPGTVSAGPPVMPTPAVAAEAAAKSLQPTFTSDRGMLRAEWPDVSLEFDRFHRERSGEVTAEVTVRSTSPGLAEHLHQARVTLTGSRSRVELGNLLAKRLHGPPWPAIVEISTVSALRAFREGEPAVLMRDAVRPLHAGFVVAPLAIHDLPTMIFGDGGAGKSTIALALGATIHSGTSYLGLPASRTLPVAYLDWEMNAWEHRERLRGLAGDEDMPGLVYVPCVGPLRDQVDRLRQVGRDHGIGYWIVDSVAPACGGEPESAEVALAFFGALRAIGGGAFCVAHTTKNGDDSRPFGSTFWHNMARATWLAKKQQDVSAMSFTVGLFNKKANTGPQQSPLAFVLTFDQGRIAIERSDVRDVPELAAQVPLKFRMQRALRSGAKTLAELAAELEADGETVKKAAQRGYMGERPLFVRVTGPDGTPGVGLAE